MLPSNKAMQIDTRRKRYTQDQVNAYLRRIEVEAPAVLEKSSLDRLIYQHIRKVPYETMDIVMGRPVSVYPDEVLPKVAMNKRGGYCFELNGAFGCLLYSLGYQVQDCSARILYKETELQKYRHRIVLAEVEGLKYLCDVGMAMEGPRIALKLTADEEQYDGMCYYRFTRRDDLGWVLWQRFPSEQWQIYYAFFDVPSYDVDFKAISYYCETHPRSPFKNPIVSVKTEDGVIMLKNGRLTKSRRGEIVYEEGVSGQQMLTAVLKQYFDIVL